MALNTFEMRSNGIKIAFSYKKIDQRLGASPPDPRLHFFTQHASPNLDICAFLTIGLSPLLE